MQPEVERVVARVLESRKYRHVAPSLVARLAEHALAAQGKDARAAAGAVKRALHQAYGSFVGGAPLPYGRMEGELARALDDGDPTGLRPVLLALMSRHASTRERAPLVDAFYAEVLGELRPRRLLDLGAGLNGLSLPLWPQPPPHYVGIDMDQAMLDFVGRCLTRLGLAHELTTADLVTLERPPAADLALMLKLHTTLEQQRPGAGDALFDRLDAPRVVVSFPTHALGRRDRGIVDQHAARFEETLARRGLSARKLRFASELVYLVDRRPEYQRLKRALKQQPEGGPEPRGSGGAQLPTRREGTRGIHSRGEGRRVPPLRAQRANS